MSAAFRVLVATDGSRDARAAVGATVRFPWPRGARASGVVGRGMVPSGLLRRPIVGLDETIEQIAEQARRGLSARWPRAAVEIVGGAPAPAIVAEARRCRARVIVLGAQGHSALSGFFLGSVSRSVVAAARCSVLVARGEAGRVKQVVVGLDGSARARRAVDLLAGLAPTRGSRVTVVSVLEPVRIPSLNLLSAGARAALRNEAATQHAGRLRAAEHEVSTATRRLTEAGWRATGAVRIGIPARALLQAQREAAADLLVVGARGTGGIERLLLGSVADAVLEQCPVSVLIAR